ncbi:ThiJ/PfpI domain-containing protein [Rhizophagus diaphanus]|nr:ThiJ/PfpI domain-containing protein [Rhizophagus diaphanus] [Rhizophagus sp. MUCL 43196]
MPKEFFTVGALLYKDYDLLDVNGSLRMLGSLKDNFNIITITQTGEHVTSFTPQIANYINYNFENCPDFDILFIPGGIGTKDELENSDFLDFIKQRVPKVKYVLTVCTGSGLLAKTGLLDGKKATTNKQAWNWMTSFGPNVSWVRKARWVVDGKFYTSSGVSAGMDMALGFISDIYGREKADEVALTAEYEWHDDPHWDPFADKLPGTFDFSTIPS